MEYRDAAVARARPCRALAEEIDARLEAGAGFSLGGLLLHLGAHGAHGFGGTGSALFAPAIHRRDVLFEIRESHRILEHRTKRGDDGLEAFPNDPLLAGILEEEFLINQATIDDARHHVPVAEHHAHESVFLASGRA